MYTHGIKIFLQLLYSTKYSRYLSFGNYAVFISYTIPLLNAYYMNIPACLDSDTLAC